MADVVCCAVGCLALFMSVSGCGVLSRKSDPRATAVVEELPAAVGESEWHLAEQPELFLPSDVPPSWKDKSGLLLSYRLLSTVAGAYVFDPQPASRLYCTVFQMADGLNGFGLYSRLRRPGSERLDLGQEGCSYDGGIAAWQGDRVVVISSIGPPAPNDVENELVRSVLAGVPTAELPPRARALLLQGSVDRSLAYFATDFLGTRWLPNTFAVSIMSGGGPSLIFVCEQPTERAAKKAFDRLSRYWLMQGNLPAIEGAEETPFLAKEPMFGDSAFLFEGRYVIGILASPDPGTAHRWISAVLAELPVGR